MKSKLIIASSFFLALVIFSNATIHAKEVTPTPVQEATQMIVKYDLAFPGILPDHPLYKLKVLRNKIIASWQPLC